MVLSARCVDGAGLTPVFVLLIKPHFTNARLLTSNYNFTTILAFFNVCKLASSVWNYLTATDVFKVILNQDVH